jgi:PleD family two-component response regulator
LGKEPIRALTDRSFENLSVLIVDGNRHMRSLVRGVLHAFGIRNVKEASDSADALRDLKTFAPHVIIVELKMDPIDGLEFTQLIRKGKDSMDRFVPIIMLTAYTERHHVMAARDAGVTEFLAKPISAEALYARVYSAVFRQRRFVETKTYVGPDRRRRRSAEYKGPERRKTL